MAGIYIHIPFCRKACHYCNFHFSTSFKLKEEMVAAIVREIELQQAYLWQQPVHTIYFGGGTPSVLEPEELQVILDTIRKIHVVAPDAEITLEANPDDIRLEKLDAWKQAGINRLSIGIQGFQDELLEKWNRSHTSAQAQHTLALAIEQGFENISADLIYGDPALEDEAWIKNIETLLALQIPHISSYALTVETGTALAHQIQTGKTIPLDDEKSQRQYAILQRMLEASGYEQYEISNFSKSGFRSRHNTSYWNGIEYLGIGPSAHSFNILTRQWNIAHNVNYIRSIQQSILPAETETLTAEKRYNEWVMTGLRTIWGIDPEEIEKLGSSYVEYLQKNIQKYIESGQIERTAEGHYRLLPAYYFFADGIAGDLFIV